MAKRMRATSPMKSTIRVGSITQPLAAVIARSWLVVAWLVFMESSFRQKSNIQYRHDIIKMSCVKGKGKSGGSMPIRPYQLIASIHSEDLEKWGQRLRHPGNCRHVWRRARCVGDYFTSGIRGPRDSSETFGSSRQSFFERREERRQHP